MQNFTKHIFIEEGFSPEFVFNKIYTVDGVRYYVSVKDTNRIPHYFTMVETDGIWKIVYHPKIAPWIKSVELILEKTILQNMV